MTPALLEALSRKVREVRELQAKSKQVNLTRKVPDNGPVRRIFRRALRDLTGGNVHVLKRVPRDRLEHMTTCYRLDHGLEYTHEPPMPLDVRESLVETLADALLAEHAERRKKTLRELTVHVVLDSPQNHRPSPGGTT
jgi:hypothetical protein